MNSSQAKENILRKIRKALLTPTPLPFPEADSNASVYQKPVQENEITFAEQFTQLQGRFQYCLNRQELVFQLESLIEKQGWQKIFCLEEDIISSLKEGLGHTLVQTDLALADAAITGCECLVARTGSIVLSTAQQSGRTASVYAPVHICIAFTSQLVYDIKNGLQLIKEKYGSTLPSLISFATGPSRTADIEKTLVIGVHGPGEVYVFLVEE